MRRTFSPALAVLAVLAALTLSAGCGGSERGPGPAPRAALGDSDPRVSAAIDDLHARIVAAPGDGTLRGELGMLYEAHGIHGAALECYEQAAALAPDEPRWPYLEALEHARAGALETALSRLERSLALDDSYLPAHLHRGNWLLDLDRLDDADLAFSRAAELDPGDSSAALGRARVVLRRGAYDDAIERLEALVQQRRGDPYVRQLLGVALQRAGRVDEVREALVGARDARPPRWADPRHDQVAASKTGFGAEMALAEDMLSGGRHAEAIDLLERLRLERPGDRPLLNNLSVAYRQAGRHDEAFAVLEDGLRRHPDYFAFHLNISSDHARRGDLARALHHLTRASELNPTISRPYVMKGQLLTRARRLEEARSAFESALAYEPDEPTSLFYGGVLSLELGRVERADELLTRTIELAPNNVPATIGLATARMRRGQLEQAAALLERAEAAQPGNRQIQTARRELARLRGEVR